VGIGFAPHQIVVRAITLCESIAAVLQK